MNPKARLRSAAACVSLKLLKGWSSNRTSPPLGRSSPLSRLSSVDFPDPEGPVNASSSPASTATEMVASAVIDLPAKSNSRRRLSPWISITVRR
jgi:hypothetical protein